MRAKRWLVPCLALGVALAACGGLPGDAKVGPGAGPPTGEDGVRGPVYLDETELLVMESYPVQAALRLKGQLPTPCHQLRWQVADPAAGAIEVEVYSIAPLGPDCIQVLEAFEETIPLGAIAGGPYAVTVNGEVVGRIDA